MQQPKRVKFRKTQRGSLKGKAHSGNTVAYGDFGLQAMESAWITSAQIEAARRAITRHIRRGGQVWIRIFPDKPATKKPAETRMGSGKGLPDHWVAVVKTGRIMFEMAGVGEKVAKDAIRLAAHKLPLKTRFIIKESVAAMSSDTAE
ncbi:MAG: 50S ribosomal protein L16 [Dehalococcoidales bacterium]